MFQEGFNVAHGNGFRVGVMSNLDKSLVGVGVENFVGAFSEPVLFEIAIAGINE